MSEAYAKAAENSGEVRAFLQRNADAFVQRTHAHPHDWQTIRVPGVPSAEPAQFRWSFELQGEGEGISVSITKYARQLGDNVDDPLARYRIELQESVPARVKSEHLPDRVPTVAGLRERWGMHAPAGMPFNVWGFSYFCASADCTDVEVAVVAGHSRLNTWVYNAEGIPPYPRMEHEFASVALVDSSAVWFQRGSAAASTDFNLTRKTPTGGQAPTPVPHATVRELQEPGSAALAVVQATGAALVAGAAYMFWPTGKAAVLALFSRLREPELLSNPTRKRLTQLVAARPGIHFKELLRRSGIPNGSLVHHLRQLQQAGLLVARTSNGYTCYFPPGPASPAQAGALKAKGAQQVLAAIRARPGLSGVEIAGATGLQPSTVAYHAKRLADSGLIQSRRDGRAVRLHPS